MLVIFIIFVVVMILWLLSVFAVPPAPYLRYTGLLPWIAVLCVYLLLARHPVF